MADVVGEEAIPHVAAAVPGGATSLLPTQNPPLGSVPKPRRCNTKDAEETRLVLLNAVILSPTSLALLREGFAKKLLLRHALTAPGFAKADSWPLRSSFGGGRPDS